MFFLQNVRDGRCWLLELYDGSLTLGRSGSADLTLDDATVSGRHACVERHADGLYINDLKSTNGTYVNDERVLSQPLGNDDVVRCGGVRLRVVLEGLPRPLQQTVRQDDQTQIPVTPHSLIEVYRPEGSLAGPACQALINIGEKIIQRDVPFLVLDLTRTNAISNKALVSIDELRRRLCEHSGDLALCAMNRTVRDSFELSPQAVTLSDAVHADLASAQKALARRLTEQRSLF